MSSSKFTFICPSFKISFKKFITFLPNILLASLGMVEGKLESPMMVTPLSAGKDRTGNETGSQPRPIASPTRHRTSASCSAVTRDPVPRTRDFDLPVTSGDIAKPVFVRPFSGVGSIGTDSSTMTMLGSPWHSA